MSYELKLIDNGLTEYEIYELEMDAERAYEDLPLRDQKLASWYDILCDLTLIRYGIVI